MLLLSQFLKHQNTPDDLVELTDTLMVACKEIAIQLREGALAGILGTSEEVNVQGETQKNSISSLTISSKQCCWITLW